VTALEEVLAGLKPRSQWAVQKALEARRDGVAVTLTIQIPEDPATPAEAWLTSGPCELVVRDRPQKGRAST
jgi:hypothetical protein